MQEIGTRKYLYKIGIYYINTKVNQFELFTVSKLHSDTSNHGESGEERSKSPKPETAPKIPDNVSPSLKENVEKIKEAAKASQESKSKFFNASVNKLLLGYVTLCNLLFS